MDIILLICIIIIIAFIYGILYGIKVERKGFNNGVCPKCGKQLKRFDTDSQGGRGYCCNDCRYFTWVSYNCVDKNFKD